MEGMVTSAGSGSEVDISRPLSARATEALEKISKSEKTLKFMNEISRRMFLSTRDIRFVDPELLEPLKENVEEQHCSGKHSPTTLHKWQQPSQQRTASRRKTQNQCATTAKPPNHGFKTTGKESENPLYYWGLKSKENRHSCS